MRSKVFVKQLTIGSEVSTPFAIYDKRLNQFTTKSGQPSFGLMMSVGDQTGKISAVAWSNAQELNELVMVDQVFMVSGRVQEYRGQPQLLVEQMMPVPAGQIALTDYLPNSRFQSEVLWKRLEAVIASIDHPAIAELLRRILSGARKEAFCSAPGGREVHHAYVGGLIEHTLEVVAYGQAMLAEQGHYLHRDLLLAGCILHDVGKIEEYDLASLSFQLTDRGRLLGHLQIGAELIAATAREMGGFPEDLLAELQHMILAHHGVPEWGSPQEPKTINAMALHLADLMSSRLALFGRVIADQSSTNNSWSPWDKFLERSIYIRNTLSKTE